LFLVSGVQAHTTSEYYHAGLNLYLSRDYDKAIDYFNAALKMDPNYVAALQGRGNCYYAKEDYENALKDYKQVQKIKPSPQVDQFVTRIHARMIGQPVEGDNATVTALAEYSEFFDKGKIDFTNKDYSSAAQNFEAALQRKHTDYTLYYYLGLTYKMLGEMREAALALGIANQKKPTSELSSYVKTLLAGLPQEDRDWVNEQLSAAISGKEILMHTRPANATDYGLRLQAGLVSPNLTDFAVETNAGVTYAMNQNGTASYNASIPNMTTELGVEPTVNLDTNVELGFLVAAIPVGTVTEQYSQPNVYKTASYAITSYVLGLNLRWLQGDGPVKFFMAVGPLLAPISINYNYTVNEVPVTGSFTGWGLGGQVQIGLDIHLDNNISFGPMLSLQAISANNFSGTLIDNSNNIDANGTLYTVATGQWPAIIPILTGQTAPGNSSPTNVDLSGIVPAFHLSASF
jgi:tetratricopeptide (TPR) repeat protein